MRCTASRVLLNLPILVSDKRCLVVDEVTRATLKTPCPDCVGDQRCMQHYISYWSLQQCHCGKSGSIKQVCPPRCVQHWSCHNLHIWERIRHISGTAVQLNSPGTDPRIQHIQTSAEGYSIYRRIAFIHDALSATELAAACHARRKGPCETGRCACLDSHELLRCSMDSLEGLPSSSEHSTYPAL